MKFSMDRKEIREVIYASWEEELGFRIADIGAVDREKEAEL